jgi:hypothetical protein
LNHQRNPQFAIVLPGFGQNFHDPPPFPRTQRPSLDNPHTIPNLAGALFVVSQELGGFPEGFLVKLVLHQPVDRDSHGLLHGGARHHSDLAFPDSPFLLSGHIG